LLARRRGGICRGRQHETVYRRRDDGRDPTRADLEITKEQTLSSGEFYTLLPPLDDIHFVKTISDAPSISIHLLANDTACVWRHRFDPSSGLVTPFRSGYANAPCPPDAAPAPLRYAGAHPRCCVPRSECQAGAPASHSSPQGMSPCLSAGPSMRFPDPRSARPSLGAIVAAFRKAEVIESHILVTKITRAVQAPVNPPLRPDERRLVAPHIEVVGAVREEHRAVKEISQRDSVRAVESVSDNFIRFHPGAFEWRQCGRGHRGAVTGRVDVNELKMVRVSRARRQRDDGRGGVAVAGFDLVDMGKVRR